MGEALGVCVGVYVDVLVAVGVGVYVGVLVALGVSVYVGVLVALGVIVGDGVKVKVEVEVGEAVMVSVGRIDSSGLGVGGTVEIGSGLRVSVGIRFPVIGIVIVDVGVRVGSDSGILISALETATPASVVTVTTDAATMTLPATTPNMEGNRDGKPNHSKFSNPIVAVVVSTPRAILTNFESPRILREVMPTCLNRFSRFNAIVFKVKASVAGMFTNT